MDKIRYAARYAREWVLDILASLDTRDRRTAAALMAAAGMLVGLLIGWVL